MQEVDDDSGWLHTLDIFKHICEESFMPHGMHAHVTHIFDAWHCSSLIAQWTALVDGLVDVFTKTKDSQWRVQQVQPAVTCDCDM